MWTKAESCKKVMHRHSTKAKCHSIVVTFPNKLKNFITRMIQLERPDYGLHNEISYFSANTSTALIE